MEICIILMLLAHLVAFSTAVVCPNSSTSATSDFFNEFAEIYYVRKGHSMPLYCCAHGYDNITWWRRKEQSWESFPPLPDGHSNLPRLAEHQQVLRFYSAELSDNTTFKCQLLKNGLIVKERELQLVVVACDSLARGPLLIQPFPQNHTFDNFGETIVLFCTGYFGCFDGDPQWVFWTMKGSSQELSNISPRYKVNRTTSFNETVITSQFTIASVQQEDLNRTFFCIIANAQKTDGHTTTTVRVYKNEKTSPVHIVIVSASASLAAFITILLLATCIEKLYGPQIRLYINSRLPGLAPNPIVVKGQQPFCHNAFIFHADDDVSTADDIKQKLSEFHYDVFTCADVRANQVTQPAYMRECCRSAVVFFLYTENLTRDTLASFFLQALIEARKGKGIMFLEDWNDRPDGINRWTTQVWQEFKTEKCQCVASDTDNKVNNVTANRVEQASIALDRKFWINLPRLKIPKKDASRRLQKNFEAALQNKIPRLKYEVTCKERATAVEERLMSEKTQTYGALAASQAISDHYCQIKQHEVMVHAHSSSNEERNDNP